MTRVAVALLVACAACGARAPKAPPSGSSGDLGAITLYRDRAIVRQHVDVDIPASGIATVRVRAARALVTDEIFVIDERGLQVSSIRVVRPSSEAPPPEEAEEATEDEADEADEVNEAEEDEAPVEEEPVPPDGATGTLPVRPTEIDIAVTSRKTGKASLSIGYATPDLTWSAAYTLVTTPARDGATLRGALSIRNATGIAFPGARLQVVDAELRVDPTASKKVLVGALAGPDAKSGAIARHLGTFDVVDGDTRVPLIEDAHRQIRTALVFDPVGTSLDRKAGAPDRDPSLGARTHGTRVTESYEIPRDRNTRGLPGGAARLLERGTDGALTFVAEARLFDATTRDAPVDAFTLGTATGVTGRRERREITVDEKGSVAEDFVIMIESTRPRSIDIVVREHLYRGQNWALPYYSAPAEKEGEQQIVIRTRVPARGKVTVMYVVVYTTPDR